MLLASNKTPHFTIVIAAAAAPAVRYAAEELQRYIDRLSLAFPRIVEDGAPLTGGAILLGDSRHRAGLFPSASVANLPHDGYLLRQQGRHILIWGASPRGTLYGVYDLLERLGVRWWTAREETVPAVTTLTIEDLHADVSPPLRYRALWYREAMDADWLARRRLCGDTMGPIHLTSRHGGAERFAADASGHTYDLLVPTERYFDSHPEYFSEVNGVRLRHMNQLCMTNPAVADIAAETIRGWLRAMPEARLASVTQNDWDNHCTCPNCAALIAKEGAASAPALHLANEVARRLEREYPDVLIDTFAYAWTEVAPRHMEAHPNVLVRIAPIGNCFGHPIASCPANQRCRDSVQDWSKRAANLFVWHYVTDFFHYMAPFPNLPPLRDDIQFYLQHGVKGIFLQGDGTSLGGDMAELKSHVMARLLWDPELDMERLRHEFLQGFYGPAATAVGDMLAVHKQAFASAKPEEHLFLYRSLWECEASYLKLPVLDKARAALENGRKAVGDDPTILARLERIEAGLDYSELFYHRRPQATVKNDSNIVCKASPRRKLLVQRFFTASQRNCFTHYAEDLGRYTTMGSLRRAWSESIGEHPTISLAAGGMQLVVAPHLGGRILFYGKDDGINLLGESSPRTFGYPCAGGFEEYSLRPHQSPGFSESFEFERFASHEVNLTATLETGLVMRRLISISNETGDVEIVSTLHNPCDTALPACLRPHLEINLGASLIHVQMWLLRDGKWTLQPGQPGGSWYEPDIPDGWGFWCSREKKGIWQTWRAAEVEAAFVGTIPAEPRVLALDLLHKRQNMPLEPGAEQVMTHRFGIWRKAPR